MTVRRWIAAFLCAVVLAACVAAFAETEERQDVRALLVYKYTEELNTFGRMIEACGVTCVAVPESGFTDESLNGCDALVTTSAKPLSLARLRGINALCLGDAFSSDEYVTFKTYNNVRVTVEGVDFQSVSSLETKITVAQDGDGYSFGRVIIRDELVYPFAFKTARNTYAPYIRYDYSTLDMLGLVFKRYFGLPDEGDMFLLIDEIYPFSDLRSLCMYADLLNESALPFIVRVMPVYENLDYPAFERYAQVLRYVQSRNGTIVIHDPIETANKTESEPLDVKKRHFSDKLIAEGIVYQPMPHDPYTIPIGDLNAMNSGEKTFGRFPFDTMIDLGKMTSLEEIAQNVATINLRWMTISDYRRRYTSDVYRYDEGDLGLDYQYIVEQSTSLAEFFSIGNNAFGVIIAVALAIIFGLTLLGRRLYKRKFYR